MIINNELTIALAETDRFGYRVFRGNFEVIEPKELKKAILAERVDIAIIRLPVFSKEQQHLLHRMGFPLLHCDTLVYYSCSLTELELKPLRNSLTVEIVNEGNINILDDLVPVIFNEYKNHYFSNPYLDKRQILDGYLEWAKSYTTTPDNSKVSFLFKQEGEPAGFATCSFDISKSIAEGILYGVHPDYAGRGIYTDMIRYTQQYFKDLGIHTMVVSTQIQNVSVQKVWTKEKFALKNAFDTYHINSFLNYSETEKFSFPVRITQDEVRKFAEFSGDTNDFHFSDEFAQSKGLKGKITHGIIISAYLSKFFGVDFPGKGTLILSSYGNYSLPIYPGELYNCTISFPVVNSLTSIYKAVCIVENSDKEISGFFYFDLMKK